MMTSSLDDFVIPDLQRAIFKYIYIDALDAMRQRQLDVALLLYKSSRKRYASHLPMISGMLRYAIIWNHMESFEWLLEELIKSYQQYGIRRMIEPFNWIVQFGRLDILIYVVEYARTEKRVELKPSVNVLTLAIQSNQYRVFKWLIRHKLIAIDYKRLDFDFLSCLEIAIRKDNLKMCKCIWKVKGCKEYKEMHLRGMPISSMRMFRWLELIASNRNLVQQVYVERAFKKNELQLIKKVQQQHGSFSCLSFRCFINAFRNKRFAMIDWLIKNINCTNKLFEAAVASDNLEMVKYIEQAIPKEHHGSAALMEAACRGNLSMFKYLVENNLDAYIDHMDLILHHAIPGGHLHIFKYVEEAHSYCLSGITCKQYLLNHAAMFGQLHIIEYFDPNQNIARSISEHWIRDCATVAIKNDNSLMVDHILNTYTFTEPELKILLKNAIECASIKSLLLFEPFIKSKGNELSITITNWDRIVSINLPLLSWIKQHMLNFDWGSLVVYVLKWAVDPHIFDWIIEHIGYDYVVQLNIATTSFMVSCQEQYDVAHLKQFQRFGLLTKQVFEPINLHTTLVPCKPHYLEKICNHSITFEGVQWLIANGYQQLVLDMWKTYLHEQYIPDDHDHCDLRHIIKQCKKI